MDQDDGGFKCYLDICECLAQDDSLIEIKNNMHGSLFNLKRFLVKKGKYIEEKIEKLKDLFSAIKRKKKFKELISSLDAAEPLYKAIKLHLDDFLDFSFFKDPENRIVNRINDMIRYQENKMSFLLLITSKPCYQYNEEDKVVLRELRLEIEKIKSALKKKLHMSSLNDLFNEAILLKESMDRYYPILNKERRFQNCFP